VSTLIGVNCLAAMLLMHGIALGTKSKKIVICIIILIVVFLSIECLEKWQKVCLKINEVKYNVLLPNCKVLHVL
jgi:hypothetical protein